MANTNFVAYSNATPITADWLNEVNAGIFTAIGNNGTPPSNAADVRTNLGLTASSGSGLIGFLQSGTGAVAQTVQDILRNLYVEPESFGAVAYTSRAAALAGTDSTAAFVAALATGKNVRARSGYYKYTGGLVVGTVGQRFEGSGPGDASSTTGSAATTLVKASGTSQCVTVTQTNNYVGKMKFDGNGLAGSQLGINAAKYSTFEELAFQNQGGTDYCLKLYGSGATVNLSSFRDLEFSGNANYGHIQCSAALYCNFYGLRMGPVNGGDSIAIGDASASNVSLHFSEVYTEGAVRISGATQNISFDGFSTEACLGNNIVISGTTVTGVAFSNFRLLRLDAGSGAFVSITGTARDVTFSDFYINDTASTAGHNIFEVDGAVRLALRDGMVRSTNTFDLCVFSGTATTHFLQDNVLSVTAAGTNTLKCVQAEIKNTNIAQTFSTGGEQYTLTNVSAVITRTNAVGLACINCGNFSANVVLTDLDTTPSVALAGSGVITTFITGASAVVFTDFDDKNTNARLHIIAGAGGCTFDLTGTNMKGNGGADKVLAAGDSALGFALDGTTSYWVF